MPDRIIHISVDIGASSGRLIAGWLEDGLLKMQEVHRFITGDIFLVNKRVRDIYRYYEDILFGLKKAVELFGPCISSIGVDSMGSDFGLLDSQGNLVLIPVSYRDTDLNDDAYETVERLYGSWNNYKICGNQSMPCDTLHQLIRMVKNKDSCIFRCGGSSILSCDEELSGLYPIYFDEPGPY